MYSCGLVGRGTESALVRALAVRRRVGSAVLAYSTISSIHLHIPMDTYVPFNSNDVMIAQMVQALAKNGVLYTRTVDVTLCEKLF